jgi:hypothetical protein
MEQLFGHLEKNGSERITWVRGGASGKGSAVESALAGTRGWATWVKEKA